MQEEISGSDTVLKLSVALDEDLQALWPHLQARQLPRDPHGGALTLSAAEVRPSLVWGAWRGLTDKAKVSFQMQTAHDAAFPVLGAHSKFVEATNRYSPELRAVLGFLRPRNRQAQGASPIVWPGSTALAGSHSARERQPRTVRDWARKSKTGLGWGGGWR